MNPVYLGLAACLLVFVATPFLPTGVLSILVGNIVSVAIVLAVVVYAAMKNSLLGVAAFLAAAALFLENRRRTIARIQNAYGNKGQSVENVELPARDLIPNEVHPPHLVPDVDSHDFQPTREEETNEFSAVGESINEKQVLQSLDGQTEDVVKMFEEKGLAP
jgi:hypothetical protein